MTLFKERPSKLRMMQGAAQGRRNPNAGLSRLRDLGVAACLSLAVWITPSYASLLVTNATFLTMKAGETEPFLGYMLVDDGGKIAAIAAGAPPAGMSASQTLDATNKILIPGFISAHSHAYETAFRGLGADQFTQDWIVTIRRAATPATGQRRQPRPGRRRSIPDARRRRRPRRPPARSKG